MRNEMWKIGFIGFRDNNGIEMFCLFYITTTLHKIWLLTVNVNNQTVTKN